MKAIVLIALLAVASCGLGRAPGEVFDAYLAAYAEGDADAMWELTSPGARLDARRLKAELMVVLADPDAAKRVAIEGQFGITVDDIAPLDDKAFFGWAIRAIRHRLGAGFVRRTVEGMHFARLEPDGDRVMVVYREASGVESRLPLAKVDGAWRVDQSPFPATKPSVDPAPPPAPR